MSRNPYKTSEQVRGSENATFLCRDVHDYAIKDISFAPPFHRGQAAKLSSLFNGMQGVVKRKRTRKKN
jgi:hypothetical protein